MKKLVSLLLLLVMILACSIPTYASVNSSQANDEVVEIVNTANDRIQFCIENAVVKSEKVVKKYELGKISEDEKNVRIRKIVDKLLKKTNRISEMAQKKCEKLNVAIVCEWEEVMIDGEIILVDPLYIVGD